MVSAEDKLQKCIKDRQGEGAKLVKSVDRKGGALLSSSLVARTPRPPLPPP